MEIEAVKLAYFSPTGTTKVVVQGIARGINPSTMELIDITRPEARKQPLQTSEEELLLVGVPVYMGRVPALLNEWMNLIQAQNTLTVCVVVYGNRAYENALLELKDIVMERGCIPIACAAYIGEHSFSNSETPSKGRPNESDLKYAEEFGHKILEKLKSISSISQVSDVHVPGTYPYGGATKLWNVDFIEVSDECSQCGICAEKCPVSAVDSENSRMIDIEKCVMCCACIKSCPQNAKIIKPGQMREAQERVNTLFIEQKKPEYFI